MSSQIPAGAEGTVAGVMIYCSICLIASSLMIWLTWTHHERTSYVALLSYFATLSIVASLVQQIHDIVRYESLVAEQFENRKNNPGNPEIAIANGSVGFSLVLYYIQYYCYGVEAMSVLFWAGYLAQFSAARSKWKKVFDAINRGGKFIAVLFPLTTILLLRIPEVQENFVVFILLADLPLMLSLLFGCILMLVIFARYVQSKRKFLHWGENGSNGTYGTGTGTGVESTLESGHRPATRDPKSTTTTTTTTGSTAPRKRQGIWDRWLMLRFTIAFVALSIFEVTNTLFQIMAVTNATADLASSKPDLSAERAQGNWIFFMPGVTPGLFIFIIFGTTTPLRRYMRETFVPKRWRRRDKGDEEEGAGRKLAVIRGPEVAPTPPPKDSVYYNSEMEPPMARRPGASRSGRAMKSDDGIDTGRSDSDEWPMLPIMKHDQR